MKSDVIRFVAKVIFGYSFELNGNLFHDFIHAPVPARRFDEVDANKTFPVEMRGNNSITMHVFTIQ